MNKKVVRIIDPEAINNNIHNKLINNSVPHDKNNSIIAETRPKNYELYNIVTNDGDSIITSSQGEEYVSLNFVIDIVKEIVQQELVAAGVLKPKI